MLRTLDIARRHAAFAAGLLMLAGAHGASAQQAPVDDATRFGELEQMISAELAPDGKRIVFIAAGPGAHSTAYVADLESGQSRAVVSADGIPMRFTSCGWASNQRLVCKEYGVVEAAGYLSPIISATRLFAIDLDGKQVRALGTPDSSMALTGRQFDGNIIDWLDGSSDAVLMAREYVPERATGSLTARTQKGLGVDRIDTRSGKVTVVEPAERMAYRYVSDGAGVVRVKTLQLLDGEGRMLGRETHMYRKQGEREWRMLGSRVNEEGMIPLAVDPTLDAAYVLQKLDGRQALYRVKLDGTLATELVLAQPDVDIEDVVTAGRNGHVIGASWVHEYSQVQYFDPAYRQLAASLAKAIPKLPLIRFVSASADEQVLLLNASSDVDPGRYYTYDRKSHRLSEVALARPPLENRTLARQRAIDYPAADGTRIPAYLTVPPGTTEARGLPAIVMPHGGPSARDEWGFDWLAQFYAARGYLVLQPNYRGSAGYGDQWFLDNGFKGWRQAIGDVADAGRWLVASGQADAAKLAIVGWSYGGYAALQSNVLAPGLFKATVAIAPVTDFGQLKEEARAFASASLVLQFIGSGAHIEEGSPRRHADVFASPVQIFHGAHDMNVSVGESQSMEAALRKAGKPVELVVYPGLDHQLPDGTVRADLLRRSDAFLRKALGITGG
jgi:dipeptidyl aminopeptidase/acylaminoacyl peptidase